MGFCIFFLWASVLKFYPSLPGSVLIGGNRSWSCYICPLSMLRLPTLVCCPCAGACWFFSLCPLSMLSVRNAWHLWAHREVHVFTFDVLQVDSVLMLNRYSLLCSASFWRSDSLLIREITVLLTQTLSKQMIHCHVFLAMSCSGRVSLCSTTRAPWGMSRLWAGPLHYLQFLAVAPLLWWVLQQLPCRLTLR